MTEASSLSLERIAEAARVIDPVFLHSPQFVSGALSERLGLRLLCKVELLNPIRSFRAVARTISCSAWAPTRDPWCAPRPATSGRGWPMPPPGVAAR